MRYAIALLFGIGMFLAVTLARPRRVTSRVGDYLSPDRRPVSGESPSRILVIVVQLAFVLVAREVSQSAVDAAARRAARPTADLLVVQERLTEELAAVVPGAHNVTASVESVSGTIDVRAAIEWAPPGPDLVPVVIRDQSVTPVGIPP